MGAGLVLVEGFPGSGKSTTAQWLARAFQAQGRAARWYYEQQRRQPVPFAGRADYASWDEWADERLAYWRAFADASRSEPAVTVLETAWLQYPVFAMLRHGAEPEVILSVVARIADVVRPLGPAVVYLAQPAPDDAYRAICERRGPKATEANVAGHDASAFARSRGVRGFEGLLQFWREHAGLCDRAVAASGLRTLTLDARRRYRPARRVAILDFLGLPWTPEPTVPASELQRFVGTYNDGTRELVVSLDDGTLVLDGLLWPRNPLLWRSGTVFDAESWPIELTFEARSPGVAGALRIAEQEFTWGRVGGVFARVR